MWTCGDPICTRMCLAWGGSWSGGMRWHAVSHSQVSVMLTVYAMLPPVTSIICMPQRNHYISCRLVTLRSVGHIIPNCRPHLFWSMIVVTSSTLYLTAWFSGLSLCQDSWTFCSNAATFQSQFFNFDTGDAVLQPLVHMLSTAARSLGKQTPSIQQSRSTAQSNTWAVM